VCGESKERVYRIDVREQAGGMEQVKRLNCGAKASRHPIVAFRIYSHGVRIRMLVEMNPGWWMPMRQCLPCVLELDQM
jgi:hypothetical protein